MSHPNTDSDERVSDDEAYRIVEAMGLGLTFRACTCGQLPCARLRPLRDALTTVRKEARTAAFKEVIGIAENEMVDADSSQNEEDFAYNRAIFDVVEAIQVSANTEEGGGDG